jgi:uncharacterized RDD family membrane protein YckC
MPSVNAYQVPADPTAVIGRRIGAFIIDRLLMVLIFVLAVFAIADHAEFDSSDQASDACAVAREFGDGPVYCQNIGSDAWATEGGDTIMLFGIGLIFFIANHIVLEGLAGGTIAKLAFGIRVIRSDSGQVCGIGKAFVRTILWVVDAVPYCFPLVGLITGLTTKGHRRVGDMAAGTLVVSKIDVGRPPMVPGLTAMAMAAPGGYAPPPPGGPGWAPPAPPSPTWGAPPPPSSPDPWAAPAPTPSWEPPAAAPPPAWEPPAPAAYEPEPEPEPAPAPEPTMAWDVPAPTPTPSPSWEPQTVLAPEPEPEPVAAEEPAAAAAETPGVGAPMWDAARNAYIQWDPSVGSWMQWDDAAGQWRPIS